MRALLLTSCLLQAAAALQLPARARVVNRAPAVRMAEPVDPRIEQLISENKVGACRHPHTRRRRGVGTAMDGSRF